MGSSCSDPELQSAHNYREAFRARSKAEFIAKCGDSLREIEEWSVLGNRDIDGKTREVAGELLGKQRVKAPTGWNYSWNPGVVERGKARTSATRVRRADHNFRYHPKASRRLHDFTS